MVTRGYWYSSTNRRYGPTTIQRAVRRPSFRLPRNTAATTGSSPILHRAEPMRTDRFPEAPGNRNDNRKENRYVRCIAIQETRRAHHGGDRGSGTGHRGPGVGRRHPDPGLLHGDRQHGGEEDR